MKIFQSLKNILLDFRHLLFGKFIINDDLKDNSKKKKKIIETSIFSTFVYDSEFINQ